MPRRRQSRIYQKRGRWYGDFRDFAAAGGRLEPLVPRGQKYATTVREEAERIAQARVGALEQQVRNPAVFRGGKDLRLFENLVTHYLTDHLPDRVAREQVTATWAEQAERHLTVAAGWFGHKKVQDIDPPAVVEYMTEVLPALRVRRGRHQRPLSGGTQRHYLNSLSRLFRYARERGILLGPNPVADISDKPRGRPKEAAFLEVWEAALLLEAARRYEPKREDIALDCAYPLVATLLLTGGRLSEVLGLKVSDVHLDRDVVYFRPNELRRLKTEGSTRSVPLWPQLKEILTPYLTGKNPPTDLLFPSRLGPSKPIRDIRRLLDELSARLGRPSPLRSRITRHTYCATRLQTLDHGKPVAEITVAAELGHNSETMVRKVYGHVMRVRSRMEHVEYRVESFPHLVDELLPRLIRESDRRNQYTNKGRPALEKRFPEHVEHAILKASAERPRWGQQRIADLLRAAGTNVSATGVRKVWIRHGISRSDERCAWACDPSAEAGPQAG